MVFFLITFFFISEILYCKFAYNFTLMQLKDFDLNVKAIKHAFCAIYSAILSLCTAARSLREINRFFLEESGRLYRGYAIV